MAGDKVVHKFGELETVTKAASGDGYTFVISSDRADQVGDIIEQGSLTPLRPEIVAQLDHSSEFIKTIGKFSGFRRIKTGSVTKTLADLTLYPEDINHEPANLVRALLDKGWQLACSIGFTSKDYEPVDPKKGYGGGVRYKSATLLETSIVVVGCNNDALSYAAKGIGINVERARSILGIEEIGKEDLIKSKSTSIADYLLDIEKRRANALAAASKILS